MTNKYFLNKAEELRPVLIEDTVELKGSGQLLRTGDEAVYDF